MTREGAEKVREAMRAISEQCMKTGLCNDCPFSCCCKYTDCLPETRPDYWFQKVV